MTRTLLLLALATPGLASAASWQTCGTHNGVGCIPTLQGAVDLAADGDEIQLAEGFYPEAVVIDDLDLVLTARPGAPSTPVLTGTGIAADGAALTIRGGAATVEIDGVIIASSTNLPVRIEDGASASLTRVYVLGGALQDKGGSVQVVDSTLRLTACFFGNAEALSGGGHIWASESDLTVTASEFRDGLSLSEAGSILYEESTGTHFLEVKWSSFRDCWAKLYGGAIRLQINSDQRFMILDSVFRDNEAKWGGAISTGDGTTTGGGAISETTFVGNEAELGGALDLMGNIEVRRCSFCGNKGGDGAAVHVEGSGAIDVANSRFYDNRAEGNGALSGELDGMVLQVRHCNFIGNDGDYISAIVLTPEAGGATSDVVLRDNLLVANTLRTGFDGSWTVGMVNWDASSLLVLNNLWYANDGGDLQPNVFEVSGVYENPLLLSYVADGECDDDEGWFSWYSPARDSGSVASPNDVDDDQTRPDIGAWGGEEGYSNGWNDTDGDGILDLYDCDHRSDAVYPGAIDIPYDGFDSDCDGWSDYDQDHDGQDSDEYGGTDCDDDDPNTYLGGWDTPYDDFDQDCDGVKLMDADGDGFAGLEGNGDDCNDGDPTIYPGAVDNDPLVDRDCDGHIDIVAPLFPGSCSAVGSAGWWTWLLPILVLRRRKTD